MGIHDLGSSNGWHRHLGSTWKFRNNNNVLEKQVGNNPIWMFMILELHEFFMLDFAIHLYTYYEFQFAFSAS